MEPKLAIPNVFKDMGKLKQFAFENGFSGIEWSFDLDELPGTPGEESAWVRNLNVLSPFEVRFHCPFYQKDLGHHDPHEARAAKTLFRHIIRLVSKAGGEYLTIHVGLGHNSTEPLSWDATIENLREIVRFGAEHRIRICLENLAWGWTSKPNLFEKLIRKSGAAVTLDIGHAHACESVQTQYYSVEDFISPHEGRVLNAHIYHTEAAGLGHVPPERLDDIKERLDLLRNAGCNWWVIEVKELEGLLHTKRLLDQYLAGLDQDRARIGGEGTLDRAVTGI